ncbi:glycosyltransferase family protein [Haladaptatus caseinilyticus]|uniref:glycosyltransferase family 39 protein n=1 Tax=Haladaptatus caseinilyticus TaxID=2993314 RepID=UPI00224B3161|nr:glycosyltransferase family 39 protein [Haladaptatus caseinilyticus]
MSNTRTNTDNYGDRVETVFSRLYEGFLSTLFSGHRRIVFIFTTSLLMSGVYLVTHPYPAYGAGLFLKTAETIASQNYALPTHVAGYTSSGVPFAYPPLAFYATALLLEAGVPPLVITRAIPALVTSIAFVPYYFLAREFLPSPRRAGIAALIATITPMLLQWHLSAGGIVRAPAFLILLSGLYVGIRLFRHGRRSTLFAALILFGAIILTHPTYSVFFGVSYLLFFLIEDRSIRGLLSGSIVAGGGLMIASPWIVQVVTSHGFSVFTSAAGTHGGLGAGVMMFFERLDDPFVSFPAAALWYVLLCLGIYYVVTRRQYFLPAWFVAAVFLMDEIRFAFIPGVMIIAVGLTDIVPVIHARFRNSHRTVTSHVVVPALILGLLACLGVMYVGGYSVASQSSMPAFIDHEDTEAMAWARSETESDAQFVVLGDAAEWFPYFSDRTILVGPWGVEWKTPEAYQYQKDSYITLSECHTAQCLTANLQTQPKQPDYLYIPKGQYTVRGQTAFQTSEMYRSLERSDRYRIVHENEGVLVVRTVGTN